MRAALIRVGIDQAFGRWNAPVDPASLDFVYVAIPDKVAFRDGLETPYVAVLDALASFSKRRDCDAKATALPEALHAHNMHLDPDFATLTYGDNGQRRGKGIAEFKPGDILVFYAGLRPCRPSPEKLIYAIIGVYRVATVARLREVPEAQWPDNAHTRRREHKPDDVIVRAAAETSGRLRRCLPIGEWRAGAYRVRQDLLESWGDLSCRNGFIQRSAVPPTFKDPRRFLRWFEKQDVDLVRTNNPAPAEPSDESAAPVIVVMLRRPRIDDRRADPLFEFGSFGLTGCHRTNLLADTAAAGARVAFAQGGDSGFRLVMLTPPIDVREHTTRREALWSPSEMPLRYEAAPLLINNLGQSEIIGLINEVEAVQRSTWEARFASAFRSRRLPLSPGVASGLVAAWRTATKSTEARATEYWQTLPRKPQVIGGPRRTSFASALSVNTNTDSKPLFPDGRTDGSEDRGILVK